MKKSRKLSLAVGGAVVALVGGVWGYTTLNGATPLDASKMATVERGTMTRSVVATGKIEPITKVEIKSKANGIIERINTDVDRIVDVGSVLVELDKENLRAREREARANLQAARAALEGAAAQLEKNKVEAEAPELDSARRNYDRAHQLHEQKLVSPQALDDARSAVDLAQNRKAAAQVQLGVSKAKIAEAQANVAQAQAAVERAEEELANATIKAPIKGTVLTRDVEIGSPVSSILNMGSAATLVMTLGDINQVFVRGKVDEVDIGRVRLGQPARITVETFKDRKFDGKVTQISPIGAEKDNVTTFEVKVSIDNPGNELKANMTANAEIVLEEFPNSLIVPEAAISYDAQRNPTVEVVDDKADKGRRKVSIKTGVGNGTQDAGARRPEAGRQGRAAVLTADCRSGLHGFTGVSSSGSIAVQSQSAMREALVQTFQNLWAHKLRSFLTMFGILWGVISVVILSATGEGFRQGNERVLKELGKNIAIVWGGRTSKQAGGERAGRRIVLTADDARTIQAQSRLTRVATPELQRGGLRVKSAFNAASPQVHGIEPSYQLIRTIDIEAGRQFNWEDERGEHRVAHRRRRHRQAAVCRPRPDRPDRSSSTDWATRSSARSGTRNRTATTRARTTTRCSCRLRRWRGTFRFRTRWCPGRCPTSSSRRTSGWSTTCRASSPSAPARSATSTGRSKRTCGPCWPTEKASTPTTPKPCGCGTPR